MRTKVSLVKYLVRFDDLCPEMNSTVWDKIEKILYKYEIKPIIAVVPNNRDRNLKRDKHDPKFWEKIRKYQADGFMIALHGYDHVYINHNSGVLGISANSEFCGLSIEQQTKKIDDGLAVFASAGVRADCFIAPSHSFDKTTLEALKGKIVAISDGHTRRPYMKNGFVWLPCQLWDRFIPEKKDGVYTVCIHHNNWTEDNIKRFACDIEKYADRIANPFEYNSANDQSFMDLITHYRISSTFRIKRWLRKHILA